VALASFAPTLQAGTAMSADMSFLSAEAAALLSIPSPARTTESSRKAINGRCRVGHH